MIKIDPEKTANFTYDDWLEFFRKIPAAELMASQPRLKAEIPTEGYAAAARWIDIIANPSKMDKLYSARLKAQNEADIMQIAIGDDDEAFYEALIRENVAQMSSSNLSAQEVARLSQNTNIFRKELREIRSRKPKKGTILEKVLEKANAPKNLPPKTATKATKQRKTGANPSNAKTPRKTAKNGPKTESEKKA